MYVSTLSHLFSMIYAKGHGLWLVTNGEIKRMPNISLISSKSSDEHVNKYVNIFWLIAPSRHFHFSVR